jgi:poly(A) polymerase Pap1
MSWWRFKVVLSSESDFPLAVRCQVIRPVLRAASFEKAFRLCSEEEEEDAIEDGKGYHVEEQESCRQT